MSHEGADPSSAVVQAFHSGDHDHRACREAALSAAEARCRERGMRFTRLRRRVLELIWAGHQPVKAYDLLETLRQERQGAAPPTVYRTLDFLLQERLIHRVESLNAYVGCSRPGHRHPVQLMVCRDCHAVAEMADPQIIENLRRSSEQLGFRMDTATIELEGTCPACTT